MKGGENMTEALTLDGVDRITGGFYSYPPDPDYDKRKADWDANLTVVNQMIKDDD